MIKVLIVEDSPVSQILLDHILSSDPEIHVVGIANNGEEALKFLKSKKPDVITMDVNMPKMDGLEATRRIMETQPVPIIIISESWNPEEVGKTFHVMEAGALALLEKPRGIGDSDCEEITNEIIQTVKLMSEVKLVRRWDRSRLLKKAPAISPKVETKVRPKDIRLIAIGASTGGPPVLQTILSRLPKDFSVPVLIVQHIAPGFIQGMIEWLGQSVCLPIHAAIHRERLLPENIYFAAENFHLGVGRNSRIALSKEIPENGMRPSVSHLLRSVTEVFGQNSVGVLLTGMGRDGARELKLMKEKGAVTIAQDKKSSLVHGMPGEAIKLGAATYVLPPERIAATLKSLVNKLAPSGR